MIEWLFIILGIVISVWNAYASGYNSVLLRNYEGKFAEFFRLANSFGIVLAFAGATYYTAVILALLGTSLGYVDPLAANALLSLNFLVLGGLLLVSGVVIAIESIIVAYYRRNLLDIAVAGWNILAVLWDAWVYFTNFGRALSVWESSSDNARGNALILLALAAIIGVVITYAAYRLGVERAKSVVVTSIAPSPASG